MKNTIKNIPMAFLGQIVGSYIMTPITAFLINNLYYTHKYNSEAEKYYVAYIKRSYNVQVTTPPKNPKNYIKNVDKDYKTLKVFRVKMNGNDFSNPEAWYNPLYSTEYKKYFSIMYFVDISQMRWPYGMKVILTVNRDDMNNLEYGTKGNPVPVLKDIGVDESIRDYEKDYDKAYMDSFYRENVIRYLKYKVSKEEFERRFKKGK